ncbi:MAG: phosphoribosylanthranilate isomerase [Thermaerobacter sp.]|nr:phosphoribosylanthranilate isomerase [Thermaerobacter sp.]
MWVKVCGCRTPAGVDAAVGAGADAVGLILVESRRRVTLETAKALAKRIPSSVAIVGVVRSPSPGQLREILEAVPFDMLQLSGTMPRGSARAIPFLRTVYLGAEDRLPSGRLPRAYALHLDRRSGQSHGGTGERVNTRAALRIAQTGRRVVLAGGLTPDNVLQAIEEAAPYGVDVASGVEVGGQQDAQAIFRFVRAAKGVNAQ